MGFGFSGANVLTTGGGILAGFRIEGVAFEYKFSGANCLTSGAEILLFSSASATLKNCYAIGGPTLGLNG